LLAELHYFAKLWELRARPRAALTTARFDSKALPKRFAQKVDRVVLNALTNGTAVLPLDFSPLANVAVSPNPDWHFRRSRSA